MPRHSMAMKARKVSVSHVQRIVSINQFTASLSIASAMPMHCSQFCQDSKSAEKGRNC